MACERRSDGKGLRIVSIALPPDTFARLERVMARLGTSGGAVRPTISAAGRYALDHGLAALEKDGASA